MAKIPVYNTAGADAYNYNYLTVSLVAYIKAQKSLDFGQGSTIAIYGTLFMILFMTIYLKLTRRGDEDEKD